MVKTLWFLSFFSLIIILAKGVFWIDIEGNLEIAPANQFYFEIGKTFLNSSKVIIQKKIWFNLPFPKKLILRKVGPDRKCLTTENAIAKYTEAKKNF